MNWFGDHLRKVHVLFVSPEWAPERCTKFNAKEYIDRLSKAEVETVEFYIKDHHGISYNHTVIGNFCGVEMLKPLVEEAHRAGLKFIAYYSVGWDKWAWEKYPDWRMPNSKQDGVVNPVDPVKTGYRQFVLTQIEEIAQNAEVDGFFLDIYNGDLSLLQEIVSVAKKHHPNALLTFNGAGGGREELNPLMDFSSIEGHGPNYQSQSCISKLMRRERKPFEVTTPGHTLGWAGWCPKPPSMLRLEAATVAAHGGSLTIGLNPYPDGSVHPLEIENLGVVWQWLKPLEEYCVNADCVADVAMLMPKYFDLTGLHAALTEHHIQFEVVKADAEFESYPLLLLSDDIVLDEKLKERVKNYVQNGGKLIAMYKSCSGLEEVLGIVLDSKGEKGEIPYTASFAELELEDEPLCHRILGMPLLIKGPAIKAEITTGQPLAKLIYPLAECTDKVFFGWSPCNPPGEVSPYPMIVYNRYGKGETLFIAATMRRELDRTQGSGAPWLKQLLANMIDLLLGGNRTIGTNVPPGVEVVFNRQGSRFLVHLLNTYAGMSGRYSLHEENVLQMRDARLWVNSQRIGQVNRIYKVPSKKELSFRHEDGWLQIDVPPFGIQTILVLEK